MRFFENMTRYVASLLFFLLLVLGASNTPAHAQGVDPLVQSLDGAQYYHDHDPSHPGVAWRRCITIDRQQVRWTEIVPEDRPRCCGLPRILRQSDTIVGREFRGPSVNGPTVDGRITPNGILVYYPRGEVATYQRDTDGHCNWAN